MGEEGDKLGIAVAHRHRALQAGNRLGYLDFARYSSPKAALSQSGLLPKRARNSSNSAIASS